MKHIALAVAMLAAPITSHADATTTMIEDIVVVHILPRFETLTKRTQTLMDVAGEECDPTSDRLRLAYGDAFDAWVLASHLRFGPTEIGDRGFALAFWPDSRGATPRALDGLIANQDPIAASVEDYAKVSIAARGFYALEFLLYDDVLMSAGSEPYHCTLVQTISADIATTAAQILEDWQSGYAATMLAPTPAGVYRQDAEVVQEMFKSLLTGLEFTADTRLGRPLGTFEKPRPTRAEARRSGRASAHVMFSLHALQDLAARLSEGDPQLATTLDASFDRAILQLSDLSDPTFASVSQPQTRLKVEILQNSIHAIRSLVRNDLGPTLGVAAGFNALDGD